MIPAADLVITPSTDPLEAARALAERLEASGLYAHVMETLYGMTGRAQLVVGEDEELAEPVEILVHPAEEGLRAAALELQLGARRAHQRVAWVRELPLDVAAVFDPDTPTAMRHQGLAMAVVQAGLGLQQPMAGLPALAPTLVGLVEEHLGERLDLDGGVATLRAIDALVDALRPLPTDEAFEGEEAIFPVWTVYTLATLAAEVGRRAIPGARLGWLEDGRPMTDGKLSQAGGLPAVITPVSAIALGKRVLERYQRGASTGVEELWNRGVDGTDEASSRDGLRLALSMARVGMDLAVGSIEDDGSPGLPRTITYTDDEKVGLGILATDDPMDGFQAHAVSTGRPCALVAAGVSQNPGNGHELDSLVVSLAAGGQVVGELLVPYQRDAAGAVTFPYGLQVVWLLDHRLGTSVVADAILPWRGVEVSTRYADDQAGTKQLEVGHGVSVNLPEGLTPEQEALMLGNLRAMLESHMEREAPPQGEDLDLLAKLGALAPFAMFMRVAPEGAGSPAKVEVFTTRLFSDALPEGIGHMIQFLDVGPNERFAMLLRDPSLAPRSLAAAGRLWALRGDDEARAYFLDLARRVSGTGGTADEAVLAEIDRALDAGQALALRGGNPFTAPPADDPMAGVPREILEKASYGPIAGFLAIAAADGKVDPSELQVFIDAISSSGSPVLEAIVLGSQEPFMERVRRLSESKNLGSESLQAMAAVCRTVPGGIEAKNAFIRTLIKVGEADGDFDAEERRRVDALARYFDGRSAPAPSQGSSGMWMAALGVVGVLVVLWVLLQIVS